MKIKLPIIKKRFIEGNITIEESSIDLDLDTSVYSEERWEQNFPLQAQHEGLFQYVERIQAGAVNDRVKVACMLKAIYCFIESEDLPNYKSFAMLFDLATPEYTERLVQCLKNAFNAVLSSSSVKN